MSKSVPPIVERSFLRVSLRRSACTIILLLVTYVVSIGPAYAVLYHRMNLISDDTSYRIMSLYSPLYYPCRRDRLSPVMNRYIGYCIRTSARF